MLYDENHDDAHHEHRLQDIELDYLYLVGTRTTFDNVVLKLHDVLCLAEELHGEHDATGDSAGPDSRSSSQSDAMEDDDDAVSVDLSEKPRQPVVISSYVERQLLHRLQE